jgi:hypothetical protein
MQPEMPQNNQNLIIRVANYFGSGSGNPEMAGQPLHT